MAMKSLRLQTLIALGALAMLTGCLDSIVRQLGPENDPVVVNSQDKFQFTAADLENVNDKLTFVWPNSGTKAALHHDSFINHGYGILVIHDAVGQMVDSTLMELDLDTETGIGTPGNWNLTLIFAAARGRVDFTLTAEH
jgi:hypothetical protein